MFEANSATCAGIRNVVPLFTGDSIAYSVGFTHNRVFTEIKILNLTVFDANGIVGEQSEEITIQGNKIMDDSVATVEQMVAYYTASGKTYPELYASLGAPTIDDFCTLVLDEAQQEGVRAELAFAQMILETGWLQFGGSVQVGQCNFGGLGATGPMVGGASFPDVQTGIRALIQHLKAYGSTDELVNECVDPRFGNVTRGIAPTVEELNGRWAVPGTTYGQGIVAAMNILLSY
jgi:hypothetical protein